MIHRLYLKLNCCCVVGCCMLSYDFLNLSGQKCRCVSRVMQNTNCKFRSLTKASKMLWQQCVLLKSPKYIVFDFCHGKNNNKSVRSKIISIKIFFNVFSFHFHEAKEQSRQEIH